MTVSKSARKKENFTDYKVWFRSTIQLKSSFKRLVWTTPVSSRLTFSVLKIKFFLLESFFLLSEIHEKKSSQYIPIKFYKLNLMGPINFSIYNFISYQIYRIVNSNLFLTINQNSIFLVSSESTTQITNSTALYLNICFVWKIKNVFLYHRHLMKGTNSVSFTIHIFCECSN